MGLAVIIILCWEEYERLGSPDAGHRQDGIIMPAVIGKFGYEKNSENAYRARILDPEKINFDTVKIWLGDCIAGHENYHGSHYKFRYPLTVIDCQTEKVLSLSSEKQYVVLRYVWGSRNLRPRKPLLSSRAHIK